MSKVAILGFGTVGSGVYEVLRTNAKEITRKTGKEFDIKYILDIRDFDDHPEKNLFTKNFDDIVNDAEVDIVAEVIGGATIAYEFTKRALAAGKSVVTSNKELVATHGFELLQLAKENGVKYLFEASVGGGIPVIRPMARCLAGNEITEISGILNGTTNYILTQMQGGLDFDVALKSAQEKGYAEANPAADIEGTDACRKIAILSSLAYGCEVDPDAISVEGITNLSLSDTVLAEKMGYGIKLIGHSRKVGDKIEIWVSPMLVSKTHLIAGVNGVFNAISVKGNMVDETLFYGRGAGKEPTASAVVADIIDIAISEGTDSICVWGPRKDNYVIDINETKTAYFVKVKSSEKDALRAQFGNITFAEENGEAAFITGEMTFGEIRAKIDKLGGAVKVIRVLNL